jgi:hypothetical protein
VSGTRIRKPIGLSDWQLAQQRARKWEAEGMHGLSAPQTIKAACDAFIADAKARELKDATRYKYDLLFRQLQGVRRGDGAGHTADMKELQSFQLSAPNEFKVRAMEVSPREDVAAVLWVTERLPGRIDIYDLASGATVQSWAMHGVAFGIARRRSLPFGCASPRVNSIRPNGVSPDVFAFDVVTGAIKQKFTTGLLTGSIAVSADGRVLAVDENCLGVFANHDPKLRVFDLSTGKRIREVSGRGAGVRCSVSSSADGSRFLAFTGKVKMKFDWSDAVPQDVRVDGTFSAWNFSNYDGIVTSQNLRA